MIRLNPVKFSILLLPLFLVACGGDDNDDDIDRLNSRVGAIESDTSTESEIEDINNLITELQQRLQELEAGTEVSFEVKIQNTTHNQPLSPPALILHGANYLGWQVGNAASLGLETLAESGSPSEFIGEATSAYATVSGDGIIMPGESTTLEIKAMLNPEVFANKELALTVASMPVNTNDGFTGTTGWNLSALSASESWQQLLPIYDAGTEANSETAATIPGPAGNGEGFNSERNDTANHVTRHPGVVTQSDSYNDSTLDSSHKFDQGAMLITVTRL